MVTTPFLPQLPEHQHLIPPLLGYTQKELAEHHCGRSDTCNGEEWNTVFEIELMSEGPSSWIEINSRGFCSTGCYEGASGAACH
jgi:hypothetical protein